MFTTFLTGFLGGAAFGGIYMLLTTPRSGKENRRVIKHYAEDVQTDVKNVQAKAETMQGALANVNDEVTKLQVGFVPEAKSIANDFSNEVNVYTRRINEGVKDIQDEFEDMNRRIEQAKN